MHKDHPIGTKDCELLLLLYMFGATLALFREELPLGLLESIPGGALSLMALLLAFCAALSGSPQGLILLPLTAPLFGAAATLEGRVSLATGLFPPGERFWLLLLATPLYFALCVWGMNRAAELRTLLHGRGRGECAISAILLLTALLASGLLLRSALK